MSVVRRIARPLLASMFVAGGVDSIRHAKEKAPAAEAVIRRIGERVPRLPDDPVAVVRLDGAAKVVGGTALALGILPRLASVGLAASLVPTTLAAHRFWTFEDPSVRAQQRIQFLKNCGLLGGLLLAAVDTEGKPSLAWWARRVPGSVKHAAHDARRDVPATVRGKVSAARDALPVG
jgi:putative oxidoreductase